MRWSWSPRRGARLRLLEPQSWARGTPRMVAVAKERDEPAAVTFITSADDSAFVARLRAGDRVAIGALFDRHADRIERVLYRVLGVDAEIPDLLQDVCVYAMTGIAKYRGD